MRTQQAAVSVVGTAPSITESAVPLRLYADTVEPSATGPAGALASLTNSRPNRSKSKPNGVTPADGWTTGAPGVPFGRTG